MAFHTGMLLYTAFLDGLPPRRTRCIGEQHIVGEGLPSGLQLEGRVAEQLDSIVLCGDIRILRGRRCRHVPHPAVHTPF